MPPESPAADRSWYRIVLTREQLDFGFLEILRAELEEIWISRGAVEGFSVWMETTDDGAALILSPVAAQTAALLRGRFQGGPCAQPSLEKLQFLLGYVYREPPEATSAG